MRDAMLFAMDSGKVEAMAHLSPLMRRLSLARDGQKVPVCPFGCGPERHDAFSYCHHVVGFTQDGRTMEPFLPPGEDGRRRVDGSSPEPVLQTDKLLTISEPHARVYRETVGEPPRRAARAGKEAAADV